MCGVVYLFFYRCAVSFSGVKATVQFPVQFEEASIGFPLEPQAPPSCLPHSIADGAPQSPTEPLFPRPLAPPTWSCHLLQRRAVWQSLEKGSS